MNVESIGSYLWSELDEVPSSNSPASASGSATPSLDNDRLRIMACSSLSRSDAGQQTPEKDVN